MKLSEVLKRTLNDARGPHSLELRAYVFLAPQYLTFSVISTSESATNSNLWSVALANVGSLTLVGIALWALSRTLFKKRKTQLVPYPSIIFAILSIGILKGSSTAYFHWLLQPDTVDLWSDVFTRVPQATAVAAASFIILASFFANLERFRADREFLVHELVREQLAMEVPKGSQATIGELATVKRKIETLARSLRNEFIPMLGDNTSRKIAIKKLRDIVEKTIRPASHRIWSEQLSANKEFTAPTLLQEALKGGVYYWRGTLPLYLGLLLPSRLAIFGFQHSLLISVISASTLVVLSEIALRVPPKSNLVNGMKFLAFLGLHGVILFGLTGSVTIETLGEFGYVRLFSTWTLLGLAGLGVGMVVAARRSHSHILERLGSLGKASDIELRSAVASRKLANRNTAEYLHGEIQNKILSLALRLDSRAAKSADDFLERELFEIRDTLLAGSGSKALTAFDTVETAFLEINKAWGGFLEVSTQVAFSDFQDLSPKCIRAIFQVTNEAMANAWRHGAASTAQVQLSRQDQACTLTVRDNGTLAEIRVPGLGSALFDEISDSNWQLAPQVGSGTMLKLQIPHELFQ